jgi:predicted HTH transcriptional regulator
MDKEKLKQLLESPEGFKLDFKAKLSIELDSEKKELTKDVIAMANTVGGRGYIVFGVEDKTKYVIGIEDVGEDMEERIQQMICYRSDPPVPIQFEIVEYEQKKIGVLTIFRSKQIPHQMLQTGAFYLRRGSTTGIANREEIARMLQQNGLVSFETVPCYHASIDDLDMRKMQAYFGKVRKEQEKIMLLTLGILSEGDKAGRYYPTYGGLLLLGKNPQCFIPHALIELVLPEGIVGIKGNILDMLKRFKRKIKKYVKADYPLEALLEVVANAMIHRDYWNNHFYIYVEVERDYISIKNPAQHSYRIREKNKIRVNSWLYTRLLLLQDKEESLHFGMGLEKVNESFAGEVKVSYDLENSLVEIRLPR